MNNKMRKNIKRKTTFLLALSMICSFPNAVSAEAVLSNIGETHEDSETVSPEKDKDDVSPENNTDNQNEDDNQNSLSEDDNELSTLNDNPKDDSELPTSDDNNENVHFNNVGKIEVAIQNFLSFGDDVKCTATLIYPDGSTNDTKDVFISKEISEERKVSFDNLADGTYVIKVEAKGFATYEQAVVVEKQMMYTLRLTTGFCNGYDYENDGSNHPGALLIGDVNNDGVINDEDKNALIDAIDGEQVAEDYVTDLNNDGNTDLIDLMFFSKSYKEENKNIKAKIESSISPLAVSITSAEGTHVDGDFSKLLSNDDTAESVKLTPADEGAISEENPVSVDIDMTNGGTATQVEDITVETGSDSKSAVDEGTITIQYVDEDGEIKEIPAVFKRGANALSESEVSAELDENGNIHVHLGSQVAVKKVKLTITKMMEGSNNLVDISKV
ncbi:MAG: hypothetical protein K2K14_00595, partial [Ruminococcus sp.]|nr:hypothetical protein [Ruminococcus sp.]